MHTSTLLVLVAVIVQCTWQLTESESSQMIRAKRLDPEGSGEGSGEGSEKFELGSGEGSGEVDASGEGSGVEASGENIENNKVTEEPTLLAFF
ncbi:hypothetical protein KIN20_001000 [Parelaphostrongylus tenuis]|uniref:Secreted protein n=1 Tax=Parelaphostrongylus tenuis TaxID=148309 RepID=A0AAD5LSZ7_PARTN|nr:hypothetical protein KIN20_001000 [Parelaphostrongylus tenuis]